MSVADQMTEAQDRMLSGMEAAQTRMIEMNQRIAEALSPMISLGSRFQVPGMDEMPKPEELVDRYFDFTAKMAEANRAYYKELVDIWSGPAEEADEKADVKATEKAKTKKS